MLYTARYVVNRALLLGVGSGGLREREETRDKRRWYDMRCSAVPYSGREGHNTGQQTTTERWSVEVEEE
jgi:hypothetical protein